VGRALKERKREGVILATRWYNNKEASAENLLKQLDKSLGRLQTGFVDVIILGGADTVDQLKNPALHEAFAAAQKEKKARFMGVAAHGKQLTAIMDHAVQSGQFDLIMPAYNFMLAPGLEKVIAEAEKKGVAVVAMKTLGGARAAKVEGFAGDRGQQVRAAIAWALKDAGVSSVVITMKSFDDVKECVGASGAKFGSRESEALRRYAQAVGCDYCRPGCSECCKNYSGPVRVQDIFRYQMYYEGYGLKDLAAQKYATLAPHEQAGNEALFVGLGECPFGVDVKAKLARADKTLWRA
jgi:predicted aldo/keto reductase-like oxidoreductase